MKSFLYSTASVAVLLASANVAAADETFSGVAQLYLGRGSAEGSTLTGLLTDDPSFLGGKAQGYWKLSPDVHFQVDVFGQKTSDLAKSFSSVQVDESDSSRVGGAVHLIHPLENRARFGIAGSVWGADVYAFTDNAVDLALTSATYGLAALEGQVYGDDWTIDGQAGAFDTFSCEVNTLPGCPAAAQSGSFARGKIHFFLNDDTRLSIEALQMWGNIDDDLFNGKSALIRSAVWTIEGEYKFPESSYAGFVALTHQSDEAETLLSSSIDTQSIMIGLKFYLDQPTLKAHERSGASFDTPQFGNGLELGAINALGGEFGCLGGAGGPVDVSC